ncbi:hypothetical protein [Saccharopolyspora phatthalungensis]|uniref:Condensation domain-containing protein n=1 Tax=Saccharopolyspora phatthalungensis TaxID=664693 RepID=A0A840QL03_9PSEU|nr:hypothetical protein [Saccharopolyspora phatthalungensis]MBB5160043.1 hypothetical protein [Saccharopolyspora phatthalungensis]
MLMAKFTAPSVFFGYSVRVRGTLDVRSLNSAFGALRQKYPVLATHLERADGGYVIAEPMGPLPDVVIRDGDVDNPLVGPDLDPGRILSPLHIVRDGDLVSLTLLIHHSIADGRILWWFCTISGLCTGGGPFRSFLRRVIRTRRSGSCDRATGVPVFCAEPTPNELGGHAAGQYRISLT